MELFLVRHGQTDANANGIVQGWLDTDLNELGQAQAQDAAESFDTEIDVIYASDLRRATQTAEAFRKKYPDVLYFEDERLRERNFGDASGNHRDQHDWEVFWASRDTTSIANAETLNEYNQRVQSFLDMIRKLNFQNVLIVTHGGTINRIQDLTSKDHQRISHANASVTRVVLQ